MIKQSKIPFDEKSKGVICSRGLCVFGKLMKVGKAFKRLQRENELPASGSVIVNKTTFWFCLEWLVDDKDIYEKK